METLDYETYILLENLFNSNNKVVCCDGGLELWKNKIILDEVEYTISLAKNITFFHILYDNSEYYTRAYPSYHDDDLFIQISSDKIIEYDTARTIADLFIFEIATSHNIFIDYAYKPDEIEEEYSDDEEVTENNFDTKNFSIFPLLLGKGIHEVIKIFNKSLTVSDFDYKILCLTRVIEYIAPTVAREKINNEVIQKLSSPQIFNPDANYVTELEKIFLNHDKMKYDNELIKLTITQIVDIKEIIGILPECICKFKSKKREINGQQEIEILGKLARCITDTRNEIAHAKANYQLKGNECPQEQKEQFTKVLLIVARQLIRWFSKQPIEKRII